MKITTTLKVAGAVLAAALSTAARADLAINENVSLLGYAAGSVSYDKTHGQGSETTLDFDAAKLGVALSFEPVSANLSLYSAKDWISGKEDLYLLDASVAVDLGKNFTLTGGRFLTWIGYEAFDIPETTFMTYGTPKVFDNNYWIIPDYHEGVKIEYTHGKHEFGLAILDSIYWGDNNSKTLRGDGSVKDGLGFELHYGYTAEAWSLGANLGYQYDRVSGSTTYNENARHFIADVWAETTKLGDLTIAGELFYKYQDLDLSGSSNLYYALVMVKQDVTDKVAVAGRLSYGNAQNYGNFWKLSAMPVAYEISNNLSIRSEVSYTRYSKGVRETGEPKYELFAGVQAVFKF